MIRIRRSEERGHVAHGWLDTRHTFSFASYHDPEHMGFGDLRVINEDWVKAGQGFGMHPHRDMEIISVVLEGAIEHRDSMGNGSVLRPGEVQVMSAGTGVTHSEFNPSETESLHLLQIWILPAERGTTPRYDQKAFDRSEQVDRLQLLVSADGDGGSLSIGQDARLFTATLNPGREVGHAFAEGRRGWVQVIRGEVTLNGEHLRSGDGASIEDLSTIKMATIKMEEPAGDEPASELLLFDLRGEPLR